MPVDPQVQRYLDEQAALGAPPASAVPPAQARQAQRDRRVMTVEDRLIPGPGGDVPIRVYAPAGPRPLPIIMYFHGGGWVIGDLDVTDMRCRLLAEWGGCLVISVDYRMAPEHPFPAALDESFAATVWAAENAALLGGDADRLAVCGDSAGGNLAAAVTLLARDQGGPSIKFQSLVYPVVDHDLTRPSYIENGQGYGLTRDTMEWYWDQYVPNLADRSNPLVSPLRAADHRGLPPASIITAEYDPLRDEGEAYAEALRAAGVPVELKRYGGMIHGFVGQAGEFDGGKQAVLDSARTFREAFSRVEAAAS